MIDPANITKFDRTDAELEEFWLFSTFVAGKTAVTQARLLDAFLKANPTPLAALSGHNMPFAIIRRLSLYGKLYEAMRAARLGQYSRLVPCWEESAIRIGGMLPEVSIERLEQVHGIGPKTARFFVMHSRPNVRVAALDTHILKHLREHGHVAPLATPAKGKTYRRLETAFLEMADRARMSPADYDLQVWNNYARP